MFELIQAYWLWIVVGIAVIWFFLRGRSQGKDGSRAYGPQGPSETPVRAEKKSTASRHGGCC